MEKHVENTLRQASSILLEGTLGRKRTLVREAESLR